MKPFLGACAGQIVAEAHDKLSVLEGLKNFLDTLEVKEVDLEKELKEDWLFADKTEVDCLECMCLTEDMFVSLVKKYFYLGLSTQHDNWKVVDDTNLPQVDRTKIYCVFTKQQYILATVINHPQDDGLLQWKCTEFPFHRYDMCEGDKYMQIV